MRVLYITKYFPPEPGGIETLSKSLCDFYSQKNITVEVCAFSKHKTYIHNFKKYKVNFFKQDFEFFSTPFSLKMFFFVLKNSLKFDYIHIITPNPWPTFFISFIKTNNIIISWGSDIINQKILKFFFKKFQNSLLKKAKKIICLSKNYLNHSEDLKKFKSKIIIIPPLISINSKKKIYNLNKKKINVISLGRLVEYKGHDIAIDAFGLLPKNYFLTIIGSGKLYESLSNRIKNLNIGKRVKILNKINDKKKHSLLKSSDIFLICSKSRAESFGIAILEALSYSLPVVVSNVKGSGMMDMVLNNNNGFLFNTNSYKDCAKKIKKLSLQKKKLIKFSLNSNKLFNKNFSKKIIENKMKKIY